MGGRGRRPGHVFGCDFRIDPPPVRGYTPVVSAQISFEKYHGLGNDFIVVDVSTADQISIEKAVQMCDRHFGIGADGVLLVGPPRSPGARASMRVINADGSCPEMCGNGLRCVVLHLCRAEAAAVTEFVVDTDAGALRCDFSPDGDEALIGTEMGKGRFVGTLSMEQGGQRLEFDRVSTGNPHAVCFRDPLPDDALDELGPLVSAQIEGGANVEIATVRSDTAIDVTVWERGVGRTLACGTGAAATAIAAVRSGRSPAGQAIQVTLPGGSLAITVSADYSAYLRGPARWVYSGVTDA